MKMGKFVGPDKFPIEVVKCLSDVVVYWLTNLFNKILSVNKISGEWRRITLISIYKNKGVI